MALFSVIITFSIYSLAVSSPRQPGDYRQNQYSASPTSEFALNESHGPWLIFAASFKGDEAEREAMELARELRHLFRVPVFVHKQNYDYRDPVKGLGLDKDGRPKKMRYNRAYAYEEVAVLVGQFATNDHPSIPELLEDIKYARPKCLSLRKGKQTSLRFAKLRALHRRLTGDKKKQQKGPMGSAFLTRNPLLPDDYFAPGGVDDFVMGLNENVKYSLLSCPAKYTVRVASFRGNVVIDQNEIQKLTSSSDGTGIHDKRDMKDRLDKAADDAHRLTMALRDQGVEAYEFHDRHESIVTVGGFDSVGRPRPDGRIEIDPSIHRIMIAYGAQRKPLGGQLTQGGMAGLVPKTLDGIPFDVQPQPVLVPRRSISADYARSSSWLY